MSNNLDLHDFFDPESIEKLGDISKLNYDPERLDCDVFASLAFNVIKKANPGNTYYLSLAAGILPGTDTLERYRQVGILSELSSILPPNVFERHALVGFTPHTGDDESKMIWYEPQTRSAWYGDIALKKIYFPWMKPRLDHFGGDAELVYIGNEKIPKKSLEKLRSFQRRGLTIS